MPTNKKRYDKTLGTGIINNPIFPAPIPQIWKKIIQFGSESCLFFFDRKFEVLFGAFPQMTFRALNHYLKNWRMFSPYPLMERFSAGQHSTQDNLT